MRGSYPRQATHHEPLCGCWAAVGGSVAAAAGDPAVDGEDRAGGERAGSGSEVDDGAADLRRSADPAERDDVLQLSPGAGVVEHVIGEAAGEDARGHGVHGDLVAG